MSRSTQEVLDHHLRAFDAKDVEGILGDYEETSFVITPNGHVLRGRSQIRPAFESFFQELSQPGATFSMVHKVVEGETGFLVWRAETADTLYELGTDTFVIRDGVIRAHTFAVHAKKKR